MAQICCSAYSLLRFSVKEQTEKRNSGENFENSSKHGFGKHLSGNMNSASVSENLKYKLIKILNHIVNN